MKLLNDIRAKKREVLVKQAKRRLFSMLDIVSELAKDEEVREVLAKTLDIGAKAQAQMEDDPQNAKEEEELDELAEQEWKLKRKDVVDEAF